MGEKAGGARNQQRHLTREELLGKLLVREQDVELPGLGLVRIRGLNVDEGLAAAQSESESMGDRLKRICLLGLVEPKLELADLEELGHASLGGLSTLVERIVALSGLGSGDSFLGEIPDLN